LRFFLALLLNLPDRDSIYRVIRQRFADADPEDRVVGWVSALSAQGKIGIEFDALALKILRYLLRGLPLASIRRDLSRVFGSDQVASEAANLEQLWDGIRQNSVLGPLFVARAPEARAHVEERGALCLTSA